MIIKIKPERLSKSVSKIGPFVIFFNAGTLGKNQNIVKYIYEVDKKLKDIKFLELNWTEYKKFRGILSDNDMNQILAYFKNKIEVSEQNPNSDNLFVFIERVVELYNKRLDDNINRLELRTKKYINPKSLLPQKETKINICDINERIILYRRAEFLRKKIKLSKIESIRNVNDVNFKLKKSLLNRFINDKVENNINIVKIIRRDSINKNLFINFDVEKLLPMNQVKEKVYKNKILLRQSKLKNLENHQYFKVLSSDKSNQHLASQQSGREEINKIIPPKKNLEENNDVKIS